MPAIPTITTRCSWILSPSHSILPTTPPRQGRQAAMVSTRALIRPSPATPDKAEAPAAAAAAAGSGQANNNGGRMAAYEEDERALSIHRCRYVVVVVPMPVCLLSACWDRDWPQRNRRISIDFTNPPIQNPGSWTGSPARCWPWRPAHRAGSWPWRGRAGTSRCVQPPPQHTCTHELTHGIVD